jgi:hypothetical protein
MSEASPGARRDLGELLKALERLEAQQPGLAESFRAFVASYQRYQETQERPFRLRPRRGRLSYWHKAE